MKKWEDLKIFELAIKNASDHIIITNPDGVILYANEAVTKITGYKPGEIIGRTPRLWGGQMPGDFYKRFWKRLKEDKKPFIGEIRNRRKNGEDYDAEIKVSPVLTRGGAVQYFVGIERDISKLKQIDQVKTEIISLTAHQLRDAPATIRIYAESLLKGIAGKLTKKQTEYVKEIQTANKTNINLIRTLLNVARLELGTFEHKTELVDLKKLVKDVIKSLDPCLSKGEIKITQHYGKDLKPVLSDPEALEIILHNLLSNACKYSPKGGKVRIEVDLVKGQTGNKKISLKVCDTGYGIPQQQQSRIFTRMFRAENIRGKHKSGSGLGLYMVKLILKQMKGQVRFKSVESEGTSFCVTLPVVKIKKSKTKK